MKTYIFHIHGMHCKACVLLTESELRELSNVTHAKSNLSNHTVEITGEFGNKTPAQIAKELTIPLASHGYTVSVEKQIVDKKWSEFNIAIPIATAFVILFIILQKAGLVNLVDTSSGVSYGTAFVIGIIASLSSCMAVVGGLLLSMSATFAKEASQVKPQLMFHVGRIASFFIFGGVIGVIGSAFTLNSLATFILSFIVAIVMLILGINLLGVFPWAKKLQPGMPKWLSKNALGASKLNHTLTPLLVGIITFFLPCGFTQSMQIYTLSTGSFLKGGLTMLAFALGTLPVLALISFSSFSIQKSSRAGIFFKSAGLIVILFALFNFVNSLTVAGIIPSIKSDSVQVQNAHNISIVNGKQIVEIHVKGGYLPSQSIAHAGIPTILRFDTTGTFDCSSSIRIPSMNISKILPQTGTTDIDIGTPSVGLFHGTCGMGMYTFDVDFK